MPGDSVAGVFCPFCRTDDTKVVDSRIAEEGSAIRRRRECLACAHRFTTFERVDHAPLTVVKSHGGDEPFDRAKVIGGLAAATKGRNVSERSSTRSPHVSKSACASWARRSPARGWALRYSTSCARVDDVAYLRFASVYKGFDGASDFHRELALLEKSATPT